MKKSVSVYGPLMKLFRLAAKVLPHSLLLALMAVLSPEQTVPVCREEDKADTKNEYAGEHTHEKN